MEYTNSTASDENCPRNLTGTQRSLVGSRMTSCEKYASMRKSNKHLRNNYKIATWNVQGLNESGKIENVLNEMNNMNIDILGISETFLKGTGDSIYSLPSGERFRFIYSGGERSRKGTGFLLNQKTTKYVTAILPISERIIAMKIQANPVDLFIIQCYAPNLDSEEEEKEAFYDELRVTVGKKKSFEILILMGDFNAKVGNQKMENIVGPYGLGNRNHSGELLINFCIENNLFICNTWFEQKETARYTWSIRNSRVKNQIDYICAQKQFRNAITNAKSRPGADCGSDHNPVVMNMNVRLKRPNKKCISKKWDITKTKDTDVRKAFTDTLKIKIDNIAENDFSMETINQNWDSLKIAIDETAKEVIGYKTSTEKKKWMTQEILVLMEERKKYKKGQSEEEQNKYKELKRKIQKLCRKEREDYMNRECEEAEELERKDSASFHNKIKDLSCENYHKKVCCTYTK